MKQIGISHDCKRWKKAHDRIILVQFIKMHIFVTVWNVSPLYNINFAHLEFQGKDTADNCL